MGKPVADNEFEANHLESEFKKFKKTLSIVPENSTITLFNTFVKLLKVDHPISEDYNETFAQLRCFKVALKSEIFKKMSVNKPMSQKSKVYFHLFERCDLINCLAALTCRLWQLYGMFNKVISPSKFMNSEVEYFCNLLNREWSKSEIDQFTLNGVKAWDKFLSNQDPTVAILKEQQKYKKKRFKQYLDTVEVVNAKGEKTFRSKHMFFETKYNDELRSSSEAYLKKILFGLVSCMVDCCVDPSQMVKPFDGWFGGHSQPRASSSSSSSSVGRSAHPMSESAFAERLLLHVLGLSGVSNWADYSAGGAFVNYSQIGHSSGGAHQTRKALKPASSVGRRLDFDREEESVSANGYDDEEVSSDSLSDMRKPVKRPRISRRAQHVEDSDSESDVETASSADDSCSSSSSATDISEASVTQDSLCTSEEYELEASPRPNNVYFVARSIRKGRRTWFVNAILQILYHLEPFRVVLLRSLQEHSSVTTHTSSRDCRAFVLDMFSFLIDDNRNSSGDLSSCADKFHHNFQMMSLENAANKQCGSSIRKLLRVVGDKRLVEWFDGSFVRRNVTSNKLSCPFKVSQFAMAVKVVGETSLQALLVSGDEDVNARVLVVGEDNRSVEFDRVAVAPRVLCVEVVQDDEGGASGAERSLVYEKSLCLRQMMAETTPEASYQYQLTGFVAHQGGAIRGEFVVVNCVENTGGSGLEWRVFSDVKMASVISEADALSFTGKVDGFGLEGHLNVRENRFMVQYLVYVAEEFVSEFLTKVKCEKSRRKNI